MNKKIRIYGIPYPKKKGQGKKSGPKEWQEAVISQTSHIAKVTYPCKAKIVFIFPKNKFPKDRPYGPDLDNHLKSLLDNIQKTFLADDSLIVKLTCAKRIESIYNKSGATIKISKTRRKQIIELENKKFNTS